MLKKSLSIFVFLAIATKLLSQNPVWVMAPKTVSTIFGTQPLPITPSPINDLSDPYDYYDGWSARHGSNGISDVTTGDLKFFIIDGAIYDGSNGQYKDYAWSASQPNVQTIGSFNQPEGDGGSEQLIVPHPANCNQYYIFGVATFWNGDSGQKSLPGYTSSVPVYALYDAETGLVINRGVWYEPTPSFLGLTISNPIFTNTTTANPTNTNGDSQVTAADWFEDCDMTTASIAGSKLLTDGSRIIACKMKNNLYSIKILPNGSLRYWKRYNHSAIISGSQTRAEFEMVFDDVSNTFKLAFESRSDLGSAYTYCVKYFELEDDFLTQLNFQTINVPVVGNGSSFIKPIAGIEFSPNKNTIYFTCADDVPLNATQITSQRVYTIDLTSGAYPVSPFAISAANQENIKYGYIEVGLDGNMYFASANGLYKLTTPNIPDGANFSTIPVIAFNYSSNFGINSSGSVLVDNQYLKSYTLPGQIDGANYTYEYNKNTECCLSQVPFDVTTYTATASGTWSPNGNNPFNSASGIITIENSIIIPAGRNITISGMTLKFAPGARLIIQEASGNITQGGKLTVLNSTLTNYGGCNNGMWQGVEVWGQTSSPQGTLTNSVQGRLIIQGSNSKIENALYGAAAWATNPNTGAAIVGKYGGIIHATNSTFLNNWYDVYIVNYGGINLSKFTNCVFETNIFFPNPNLSLGNHIHLVGVRNIFILGCDFKNSNMALFPNNQGIGIFAVNSGFAADRRCTSPSTTCIPDDPNTFTDLSYGIYNMTSGSSLNFRSDGNSFFNNKIGIVASGTSSEQIVRNKFEVREIAGNTSSNSQTAGISLNGSTAYKIEENTFSNSNNQAIAPGSANSYGIVIRNSGTGENVVYRNTFSNLKIGCQSEGTNGSMPMMLNSLSNLGLVWKCNSFYKPIYKNDIISIDGRIKYRQGFINPNLSSYYNGYNAANNRFSLLFESEPEHDFQIFPSTVAQNSIVYTGYSQPQFNDYNLDSYTVPRITETNLPITFRTEYCPTNFSDGYIVLKDAEFTNENLDDNQTEVNEESKISEEELKLMEFGKYQLEKNSKIQEILLDTTIENTNETLIQFLSQHDDEASLKMLAELQIGDKDVDSLLNSLQNENVKFSQDYIDLMRIKSEMLKSEDYYSFLSDKENLERFESRLLKIAENTEDVLTAHQASILLSFSRPLDLSYYFLEAEEGGEKSMQISTSNTDSKSNLIVYPNPVKSKLSIQLSLEENEKVSATIFSVLGKTMGTWELSNENNGIDVNHFQGGVYLIHVNNAKGENIQTLRFVKQ